MVESRQKQKGTATRSSGQQAAKARSADVESVRIVANSYCLTQYGVGYSGGTPRRLLLQGADVWIVPAVLTSPGSVLADPRPTYGRDTPEG
jgi:hypothetical protein